MSTIKSSSEDLTLNADGSNEVKFQINAVEKASINSSGLFTSTTIDATKLTGEKRNFIIDGDFTQWPAGTSISCPINTNTYGGGLWRLMSSNSAAVVSVVRGTDVPTVAQSTHQSAYSLDIDYTTADASLGTHDILGVDYVVTGSDYAHLHGGQQVTLAFWIKATITGTSCVYFINSGHNRSYVAEFTISSSDTWEYKTITFTTDNTGTWLFTEADVGLRLGFAISHIGATYHATNETWTGGGQRHSTSNQVNHASSTSNIFRVSQVGLYLGNAPTFSSESVATVKDQVEYYVERLNYDAVSGERVQHGMSANTTSGRFLIYASNKRRAPTCTSSAGDTFTMTDGSTNETGTGTPTFVAGRNNLEINVARASGTWTTPVHLDLRRDGTDTTWIMFDARH